MKSKMNVSVITAAGLVIAAILVTYNFLSSPSYNTRHTALSYTQNDNSSDTILADDSSLPIQSVEISASSEPSSQAASISSSSVSAASSSPSSSSPPSSQSQSISSSSSSSEPAARINVNTATSEELQKIKRIGPTLAERIIEYRNLNGPFSSLDELLKVKGIGEKTLEIIKECACV